MTTRWIALIFLILFCLEGFASKPSYHNAHPIGWMHALPVGETPGWSKNVWLNLEFNHANIWNNEFNMTNDNNGKTLTYGADFEQGSIIADFGFALASRWSVGVVAPFASRGGGALDDFIDQFHVFIGSERFLRPLNDGFAKSFEVKTAGQNEIEQRSWTAVGNLKLKSKLWLWQWRGSDNGSCDCGLAVSGEWKIPLARARSGFTSGHHDQSVLVHLGAPLFDHSGIWATAGFTRLGKNEMLQDWPTRKWAQMYELSIDLAFTKSWGLLLQARTESPILNKNEVSYDYPTSDPKEQLALRVASGWNSLVYWRGSQSLGFRWRSPKGTQINFMIIEDWGLGGQDTTSDSLYVNNAPDVAFATQFHFPF